MSGTAAPVTPVHDDVNISSLAFWSLSPRERDRSFAELRRTRPVSFHRPLDFGLTQMMGGDDPGYWAVTSHRFVQEVSRDPETFCSSKGTTIEDVPIEFAEAIASFLVMDGRRHLELRRLVSSAFTPRHIARIEAQIADQARRIVDRLLDTGDCDFVEQVSAQLPMMTISEMIGVPEEDRERAAGAAAAIIAMNDPEATGDNDTLTQLVSGQMVLRELATGLAHDRRAHPRDDLMTALVSAEIEGRSLTDEELGAFTVLLSVAGNDTTRQTVSHGTKAFSDHPDQRERLAEDPAGHLETAVEELVRWATPVMQFRRTATRDTELGGSLIAAGDKVVIFYTSANRDDAVIPDPWTFDISRSPNPHLGFGGGGPHFCLGAHLARAQLRSMFSELICRVPHLEVGEPEYMPSGFINSIKRMPCTLGPT